MNLYTRLSVGHRITINDANFTVKGSASIRGKYSYHLFNESTNQKSTLSRENFIKGQQEGSVKVIV